MAVLTKAEGRAEDINVEDELLPSELQKEAGELIDPNAPVESGSELVEGDLEEGETPYEGEDGTIEIENNVGEEEPSIDIEVGE